MTKNDKATGRSFNINPEKLTPYERNSRVHSPAQVEMISDSIGEFGFLKPVLIDEDRMILAGHGAVLAALLREMTSIPVRQVSGLTDQQKRGYVIADNRASELSKWDWDLLSTELGELQSIDADLKPLGFGDFGTDQSTHHREGANVTIGDGRFLLQLEFDNEKELEAVYRELDARGIDIKVLE